MKDNINYILTREQAESICKHFKKNLEHLEDFEVCELLDKMIDEVVTEDIFKEREFPIYG